MIEDYLINQLEESLNDNDYNLTFKLWSNLGDYQESIRIGNQQVNFVNAIVQALPAILLPIPNVKMVRVTFQITFAINIDMSEKNEDGQYELPIKVRQALQEVAQSQQAIITYAELEETTYQILPLFTLPSSTESVTMTSDDTGEVLPMTMSIEYIITENIANANSYKLKINGHDINFEQLIFTKQRTANQYTYKGNSNTKTNVIQGAVGIDVTMPQFLDESSDLILNDIFSEENNQSYYVEITYPISSGNITKQYIMTSGTGQLTAVKTSNVGINFSLAEKRIETLDDCSWDVIKMISEAGLASKYFSIGDEKHIKLTTKQGELDATVIILGFNSDTQSNGSTAGMTLMLKECLAPKIAMDEANKLTGWGQSTGRKTTRGYISYLPQDLQNAIKTVNKTYSYLEEISTGNYATKYTTVQDNLFLLSDTEIVGEITPNDPMPEGKQYELFEQLGITDDNNIDELSKIVLPATTGQPPYYWWTRTIGNANNWKYINPSGSFAVNETTQSSNYGFVSFAFCI